MPSYVSKNGVWHPAKERAVLPHIKDPEKQIYEGPDRAALLELWKEGVETMGQDFRKSPDFLQMLRERNFKTEKEYFKFIGFDPDKANKEADEKASKVEKHEMPEKVEEIKRLGGGQDTTGSGQDKYGGFGLPSELQ